MTTTSETSQKSRDYEHNGNSNNNNHNHMNTKGGGDDVDGDVAGKVGPLLVNGSTTTPRIVSPSSAGNGNASFGGTVSSTGGSIKSRRFYPRKPSVVAIESMSDSSSAGIPSGFHEEMTGVSTTSSTSGGTRRDNASVRAQQRQRQGDGSEICVLSSDGGSSSATYEEIRGDGEGSRQGLDPVNRIARHIATAAAAALAAAEAEADGRDIALRVDMHQKNQQLKKEKKQEDMNGSMAREDHGVGSDVGDMGRDRGGGDKAERAARRVSVLDVDLYFVFHLC